MAKALDYLKTEKGKRLIFWFIFAVGIFARVYEFGSVPGGINQDEAFAGYEAYSILKYGIDTAGYHNPLYLVAWGSGMNALESYLMMPFIALFGLKTWVIRIPQLIVACCSLAVVYLLVKRLVNEKAGLLAMFMLAVCPWHIMLSRWGLESNLAPGFLLFGLYFFVKAMDNPRYMLLSALMYGLSLYAYSSFWLYIPFIILFELIYCLAKKKIRFDKWLIISGVILAAFAVPMLLFLLINKGYMEEIRTPLFSIPKLLYMRTDEISFDEKRKKLELVLNLFFLQTDKQLCSSPTKYGLFYYFSLPFTLFGLVCCVGKLIKCLKKKEFCPEFLILIQLFVGLPQLILVKVNVNRAMILFIPMIILTALGIYYLGKLSFPQVTAFITAVFAVAFIGFECYYFGEYPQESAGEFADGFGEALTLAMDKEEKIFVDPAIYYPKVLFYAQTPVTAFRDTVEYLYYPYPYLNALRFDRFDLQPDVYHPQEGAAYVLWKGRDLGLLPQDGYTVETYGEYILAYK